MAFTLPSLSYGYDALEPHFDARTMEIHHTKHHQTYLSKLNDAIAGTSLEQLSLEALIKQIDESSPAALRNNGGGFYNHNLFWSVLAPPAGTSRTPNGPLAESIQQTFDSFEGFKEKFAAAAVGRFGSGWVWLGVKGDKTLCLCSTPNQDNPLMKLYQSENDCTPILGLDVWEHAYYLKYQNRRPDYVKAFWEVVNWQQVEKHFAALQ